MEHKYIQWFCAELFDNWSVEVDVRAVYTKFREEFPTVDQDTTLSCMTKAIKIIGATKNIERDDS